MRLWAHAHIPKNLKQLFTWSEYLYYNSAQIYAGVRKFAEYPITEVNYLTASPELKKQVKKILEEVMGIKRIMIRASLDLQVYGNSFVSVHLPFKRFIGCSKCSYKEDIRSADFTLKVSKMEFYVKCPSCGKTRADIEDKRVLDPKRINIIRWDPKRMTVAHNPVTNENEYYLEVPGDVAEKVKKGDRHFIATMPISFLKTISKKKVYKFERGSIYHMKSDAPAGVENGWGFPPLIACMHLFYHAAILRKANESIALDRIVPLRVMHPQAISGNADPILTMSMSNWIDDMQANLKKWRRDPNHIMFSPVAVGVSQVGGEGRALMVDSEIQRAEDNIIAALGFPKEFVYGGLSFTGSSVTLRMLENQLETAVFQLNNLMQWITDKVCTYMGWPSLEVRLGDFKMVDDVQQKQLAIQLWQGGVVSKTTLAEAHGIDLDEERARMHEEQLADATLQKEIQKSLSKLENTIADQARAEAESGEVPGMNYDQQAIIGQAEMISEQLLQMDPNTRRSQLSSLQSEDYIMYAVVIQRMEQMQLDMKNEAASQAMQGMM
tara:strand:- start:7964 stop:9616 length:1653 start_codon:yes stop_codon:yes gene_type:complete